MHILASLLLSFLLLAGLPPAGKVYEASPSASTLTWTGYAAVGSWAPEGTIRLRRGMLKETAKGGFTGEFVFDMASLKQKDSTLTAHLKGPDFFNAPMYPTSTFALTKLSAARAYGNLTIKGVTKPINFPVTIRRSTTQIEVKGKARIDRTAFGVTYNSTNFFSNLGDYAIADTFQLAFDVRATVRK